MRYIHHLKILRKKPAILGLLLSLALVLVLFVVVFRISNLDIASFVESFSLTLAKVGISYVISFLIALALAFITLKTKTTEKLFLPVLDVLQSFPSFAFLPILILYFGKTLTTLLVILTIEMIWPLFFAIVGGFKAQREDLSQAATIFGATGLKRIFAFTLPAVMPAIITGSIVAWGEAWEVVIGAEIILASRGLGNYFSRLGTVEQTGILVAAVLGFLILLFIINKLLWLPLLERATAYQTE